MYLQCGNCGEKHHMVPNNDMIFGNYITVTSFKCRKCDIEMLH